MKLQRRNLDIFIAGAIGLLGGAAYAAHVPSAVQVILGIALFFAPGYLWSEAILSQRLPAVERALATAGMSLIFPILGGFLFYALKIPLYRSAWVGLLVVLTLLGVVAAAVERLRQPPADADGPRPEPGQEQSPRSRAPALHVLVYGLAAVIGLGTVAFSVHSANAQKSTAFTMFSMAPLPANGAKATLAVTNHEGNPELYQVKLRVKGKLSKTWPVTLANGQTWQTTIAYTGEAYAVVADLYRLPDTTDVYRMVDNGQQTKAT